MGLGVARCSWLSRERGEDPIGSAPEQDHLFVEVPLPWPAQWQEAAGYPAAELSGAVSLLAGRYGIEPRLVASAPDTVWSEPGRLRVLAYRHAGAAATRLTRFEYTVPPAEVGAVVREIFAPGGDLTRFAAARRRPGPVRDVFVCTHGARDGCCGSLGVPVYQRLRAAAGPDCGLRVWRASHLGGHRYAGTLVDFPTGRYWGHLDAATAHAVVSRDGSPAELARRYRGRAGLPPAAQVLERELFVRYGWAWDDVAMDAAVHDRGGHPGRGPAERVGVRLRYRSPDGRLAGTATATATAAVEEVTAGCGLPPSRQPRYRLADLALAGEVPVR